MNSYQKPTAEVVELLPAQNIALNPGYRPKDEPSNPSGNQND